MGKYKDATERAAQLTNEQLTIQISSLTKLKKEEIETLFPDLADKEKLDQLISIVQDSTSENEQVSKLKDNIENLAGTAVKLLRYLI
jgi:hypothetical protein